MNDELAARKEELKRKLLKMQNMDPAMEDNIEKEKEDFVKLSHDEQVKRTEAGYNPFESLATRIKRRLGLKKRTYKRLLEKDPDDAAEFKSYVMNKPGQYRHS